MAIVLGRKPGGSGGGGGAPSGPAGGSLAGTYPNPTIAAGAVDTAEIANDAVDADKIDGADAADIRTLLDVADQDDTVLKALYDANTVLAANSDNTPAAVTMGSSTILARLAAGNIKAASVAEIQALLGTPVKIGDIDLTSTQTFTGIPGTYSDLRMVIVGRGTQAAATINVGLQFNNDTGANYETNLINASNNAIASAANAALTDALMSVFPGASATANRAGMAIVDIPEYAGGFHKIFQTQCHTIYDAAAANSVTQIRGSQWRNVAAITEIDILVSAGAWAAGSTARLYGIP